MATFLFGHTNNIYYEFCLSKKRSFESTGWASFKYLEKDQQEWEIEGHLDYLAAKMDEILLSEKEVKEDETVDHFEVAATDRQRRNVVERVRSTKHAEKASKRK